MAILVLLGIPKMNDYQKEARLTNIKNNIKVLEGAAERYYLDHLSWPRSSSATPLTKEELETYANEILDLTGENITLEDGNYYPIDYEMLNKYSQKPKDGFQYILQNPVGNVYFLDNLTTKGKEILNKDKPGSQNPGGGDTGENPGDGETGEVPENPETPIVEPEPSPEGYFTITTAGAVGISQTYRDLGTSAPVDLVIPKVINGFESKSIAGNGFKSLSYLKSLVIPEGVTTIGNNAFENTNTLTSIKLPETLTTIGDSSFKGITDLSKINIPKNVVTISNNAFSNLPNTSIISFLKRDNKQITVGTGWYGNAVVNFEDINDYYVLSGNYVTKSNALSAVPYPVDLVIPSEINGTRITDVSGFGSLNNVRSVVISEGIKTIWDYAFSNNTKTESIVFPSTLTIIGRQGFSNNPTLKSLDFKEGLLSINEQVFMNNTSLTNIKFPESLTSIGEYSFAGITNELHLKIPKNVNSIAQYVFRDLSSSSTITIQKRDNKQITIGAGWHGNAVVNFEDINDYYVLSGNYVTKSNALSAVPYPVDLVIPSEINGTRITDVSGFGSLNNVRSVVISEGIKTIWDYAFSNNTKTESIVFPSTLTIIGRQGFSNNTSLKNLNFKEGLIAINEEVFRNNTSLTEIKLPESLTSIGEYSFAGITNDLQIKIPKNVTKIAQYVFQDLTSNSTITLSGRTDTTGMTLGSNWKGNATLLYE